MASHEMFDGRLQVYRRGRAASGSALRASAAGGFEARLARNDWMFRRFKRELLNRILDEERLKFDRDGQRRTAYSLRHTYICMRLMKGSNIHQIANNFRTSSDMIENHYAAHIIDRLLAAEINTQDLVLLSHTVRKARRRLRK